MNDFLIGIQWLFLGLFGGMFLYLVVLSLLAHTVKRKQSFVTATLRRFAIVVPAHNEERSISRTLRSLTELDYPSEQVDIFVVADNCTDRTASIAGSHGVQVLQRTDPERRGKGYALAWAFDRLVNRCYDALVVVDADSTVTENFLVTMNAYIEEGYQVLQALDLPERRPGVWSSEVVRLGMTLYNVVRPLGRRAVGFTAGLRGNGMCFTVDTLRKVPWTAFSLTEDIEYGLQLLMEGVTTTVVPEATVYTLLPDRLSSTQRERWEAGRLGTVRKYVWTLVGRFLRTWNPLYLDALLELIIPPFVNTFSLACLSAALSAVMYLPGLSTKALVWGWVAVLGLGCFHVLAGLLVAQVDRHLIRALAYVPKYAVWKFALYASVMKQGTRKEWIRTRRE